MKKYLWMLAYVLSAVMVSCSGSDDDPTETPSVSVEVTSNELAFSKSGGEAAFAVSAPSVPKIECEADWLSVEKTGEEPSFVLVNGSKKRVLKCSYKVSAGANLAEVERTSEIQVKVNGVVAGTVAVTQAKGDAAVAGLSAKQVAAKMYPGWNLGNTLEATGDGLACETSWQPTQTSQAIIDYVKAQGFKSIRIPCSWYIHSNNGKIDAAWMARVKEVVNYCISAGLYVMLNDHWDNGWIEVDGFSASRDKYKAVDEATITSKIATLKTLWTQIAQEFAGYDQHLLFAGLNEPFQQYDLFSTRHEELTPILMRYNQAFIDAVRAAGGNNAERILVVQGPSTNTASTCKDVFQLPADKVKERMMVEVHFYEPWDFCGQETGAVWFWGEGNYVSGSSHNASWGKEDHMKTQFAAMKKKFYDKGVPVIIGECATNWRQLSANQKEHDNSVKAWYKELHKVTISNGCIPMVWDTNSPDRKGEVGTSTIIDRSKLSVFGTIALEGIQEGVKAAQWPN